LFSENLKSIPTVQVLDSFVAISWLSFELRQQLATQETGSMNFNFPRRRGAKSRRLPPPAEQHGRARCNNFSEQYHRETPIRRHIGGDRRIGATVLDLIPQLQRWQIVPFETSAIHRNQKARRVFKNIAELQHDATILCVGAFSLSL
jgi:hypothetical protein